MVFVCKVHCILDNSLDKLVATLDNNITRRDHSVSVAGSYIPPPPPRSSYFGRNTYIWHTIEFHNYNHTLPVARGYSILGSLQGTSIHTIHHILVVGSARFRSRIQVDLVQAHTEEVLPQASYMDFLCHLHRDMFQHTRV